MKANESRTELQEILEEVLGSSNVYFNPPENLKMKYPAIVYFRDDIENRYANNKVYLQNHRYSLTVITLKANDEIVEKVSMLPMCSYTRNSVIDGLYHDYFTLYYK